MFRRGHRSGARRRPDPRVDGRGRLIGRSEHSRNGYRSRGRDRCRDPRARGRGPSRGGPWVHPYALPERHGRARDDRPNYGVEAATALGIEPERVFKTLVAAVDSALVLAVVPVDRELDLKRLATAAGGHRAVMAEPAEAERPGYVVGGPSARSARAVLSRSSSTRRRSSTRPSSCRPVGAVSSSSLPRATWCV